MSKLLNGVQVTGPGHLNGKTIATEDYVDTAIAALSYSSVGEIAGNGVDAEFIVTHNAGTKDIIVCVRDLADDTLVMPTIRTTANDTVTVSFAAAPTADARYRVVVCRAH